MESPFTKRIVRLLDYLGLSQEKFGKSIGVTRASVNQWANGSTEPAAAKKIQILETYPEINANWFLFGRGDITSDIQTQFDEHELLSTLEKSNHPLIKFLNKQNEKADEQYHKLIESKDKLIYMQESTIDILREEVAKYKKNVPEKDQQ